jgi:hypothetical protein
VGLLNPHLEDDDFADVWTARSTAAIEESDRPAENHLRKCGECRVRYVSFASWLDGLRVEAHTEADEVFNRDRLATQQQQIFRRLESLEHPARVIAFPRFTRPVAIQNFGMRWTAAAAAVGLVTGIGLGQLIGFRTPHDTPAPRAVARAVVPAAETNRGLQPVSGDQDETFIEPETMSSQVRVPESLQYLNAITPGARDFDPR